MAVVMGVSIVVGSIGSADVTGGDVVVDGW